MVVIKLSHGWPLKAVMHKLKNTSEKVILIQTVTEVAAKGDWMIIDKLALYGRFSGTYQ